jgi:putative flippase GtrA
MAPTGERQVPDSQAAAESPSAVACGVGAPINTIGVDMQRINVDMERIKELVRYGIVGTFNAVTYLALYSALVLIGMRYVLAAIVAFPLPVALGYWLHERWTFARNDPTMRRLGTFLILQIMAFGVGLLLLIALVNGFGVNAIVARIVATPVAPLVAYVASRALIFAEPRDVTVPTTRDRAVGRSQ